MFFLKKRADIHTEGANRSTVSSLPRQNDWSVISNEDRNKIIEENVFLVRKFARLLSNDNDSFDDAFQCGILGLIKAVEGFNPEKEIRFSTYAAHFIRGSIIDGLRSRKNLKVDGKRVSYGLIDKVKDSLLMSVGREPSSEEIACEIIKQKGWPDNDRFRKRVLEIIQVRQIATVSFEESDIQDLDRSAANDPEKEYQKSEDRKMVQQCITNLSVKEKLALKMSFWDEETVKEIARVLNVSAPHASRLLAKAKENLKRCLSKKT